MTDISDNIINALLNSGYKKEELEGITTITEIQFERRINQELKHLQESIQKYMETYYTAMDLKRDHVVKFYQLPYGAIGYVVLNKKKTGFQLD